MHETGDGNGDWNGDWQAWPKEGINRLTNAMVRHDDQNMRLRLAASAGFFLVRRACRRVDIFET